MKFSFTSFTLLLFINSYGQNITGKYKSYDGYEVTFESNSIYNTSWRFCTSQYWSVGNYKLSNDTIYLTPKIINDTVNCAGTDSAFPSQDKISQRFNCKELEVYKNQGYSIYQENLYHTIKLFRIQERLYFIGSNGKIIKKSPGIKKSIGFGKNRLDGKYIQLFSWQKYYPAYLYEHSE